ncbi:MAG: sigma-70 family RNA polymerase sigma factor [Candidatus Parabeggiatoa sp.]|nr:sigma-70 family RNA polymerase sigma factor [Candidatus Parabeggiatoa sp.]
MDDKAALEDIRKGGQKGFTILYNHYVRSLRYQLITKYHIPEGSVDDVLQEIFVKFFKSIDTFKQDCSVSTWLYWIGKSVAIDYWRQRGKEDYPKNKRDDNQDVLDETTAQQEAFKAQPPRTVSMSQFYNETEEGSRRNEAIEALLYDELLKEQSQKAHNDLDIQMCFERALAQLERDGSKASLLKCLKALTFQAQNASIKEIALEIERTPDATRRYLSDCRAKLKQYQPIQGCRELLNGN